ncbi:MAG: hypothetical protein Hyperionvirus5_54 [Hyperionvirus sp.]|uniref:Uncharacterized protein n=1 Tax=Hyperionvirus sp. TaxID=2487770 RepID=A0A3G5A7U2_9VIRU|nr:MAG: hypothetical protein Hyperionvirus5_54 [Hyperionvirus sp.]
MASLTDVSCRGPGCRVRSSRCEMIFHERFCYHFLTCNKAAREWSGESEGFDGSDDESDYDCDDDDSDID